MSGDDVRAPQTDQMNFAANLTGVANRFPHPMFFPVGCVLVVGDYVEPVLDPECVCDGPRCCLRAQCACHWETFFQKAYDVIQHAAHYTAKHKVRALRVVCEQNPQVVLGELRRNAKGNVTWKDSYTVS